MNTQELKKKRHVRRKKHVRKAINISDDRPRLTVYKSLNHIYAQIIDDVKGVTIAAASTIEKEVKQQIKPKMLKVDISKIVGDVLAKRALDKEIKKITFDRNGFMYHGRIKALADAARKSGLEF